MTPCSTQHMFSYIWWDFSILHRLLCNSAVLICLTPNFMNLQTRAAKLSSILKLICFWLLGQGIYATNKPNGWTVWLLGDGRVLKQDGDWRDGSAVLNFFYSWKNWGSISSPTWWCTAVLNFSSRWSHTFFFWLLGYWTYMWYTNIHLDTNIKEEREKRQRRKCLWENWWQEG